MPLDYVLGPAIRQRVGGATVRLADDARKCVVFLGFPGDTVGGFDTRGTGFFVSFGEPSRHYLVTCGHVAEAFKENPWGIRFNGFDGRADVKRIDSADWVFHPEYPKVDIAVLETDWPEDADGICYPARSFASSFKMGSKDFGAGDLVYVSGLFRLFPGRARNQTFVHTGHVAILPDDELMPVHDWRVGRRGQVVECEGYIIEVSTLPGSSGSPVFIRRSIASHATVPGRDKPVRLGTWVYGSVWLLGIWCGGWDAPPGDIYSSMVPPGTRVPVGLGRVAPAYRLIEVLEMPSLRERRERARVEVDLARAMPVESAPSTTDANPQHKEDFTRLLNAAVQKPTQGGGT